LASVFQDEEFKKRALQCISSSLDSFGTTTKKVIYYNLETQKQIGPEEIISRPKEFIDSLRIIFSGGAPMIEKKIIRDLQSEFHLTGLDDIQSLESVLRQAWFHYANEKARA